MNMVDPAEDKTVKNISVPQEPTIKPNPVSTSMETAEQAISYDSSVKEPSLTEGYHYIEDLPSKYKLYPDKTKIFARPLKILEVKTLSTINENNINAVINEVLQQSIKGYPVEKLLVADKLYLIFWLRANTYQNSGYVVDFECVLCEKESTYEFAIDNLDVDDIKADYNPDGEIVLPKSQDVIKWEQIRVENENAVKDFIAKHRNALMKFNSEILSVANLITEINGEKKSMLQKYEYLVAMHPHDNIYLESYIRKYELGINPIMNVKCSKCGGNAPVEVVFRRAFFIPRAEIK